MPGYYPKSEFKKAFPGIKAKCQRVFYDVGSGIWCYQVDADGELFNSETARGAWDKALFHFENKKEFI